MMMTMMYRRLRGAWGRSPRQRRGPPPSIGEQRQTGAIVDNVLVSRGGGYGTIARFGGVLALLALAVALLLSGMTPTAEAQSRTIDYDIDDDGLIEIRSLEQLNAMRHSNNGIAILSAGAVDTEAARNVYDAAFPRRQVYSANP